MKITDFAPRTGAIEAHLTGVNLTGAEVGCDVGAHAESLLTHCSIRQLHLIDVWENIYCLGYCEGRLSRWRNRVKLNRAKSAEAVNSFGVNSLDFVYIDAQHDYISVREDLTLWWARVKDGGILALRNYNKSNEGLFKAANEFINKKIFIVEDYHNEILIFK